MEVIPTQKVPEFEFTSRPTRTSQLARTACRLHNICSGLCPDPVQLEHIVVQISMTIEDLRVLDLANLHPDILNGESLTKNFSFFTYLPQFKTDILIIQDSKWLPNVPPCYLPISVTKLLANLCETTEDGVDRIR